VPDNYPGFKPICRNQKNPGNLFCYTNPAGRQNILFILSILLFIFKSAEAKCVEKDSTVKIYSIQLFYQNEIKDMSAGAVLLAAIASLVIAGIIFLPKMGF